MGWHDVAGQTQMTDGLRNVRVAFLVASEGIEQGQLLQPWQAVLNAGGEPELIAPMRGMVETVRHNERAGRFPVDRTFSQVSCTEFDAAVLPGGMANTDRLRRDNDAVEFLIELTEAGKPIAAICHAAWMLVEGDLVCGRTMTSWPSLKTDLRNGGATWVDQDVVVCAEGINTLVTSRQPEQLGCFCREMTAVFAQTRQLTNART